MDEVFQRFLRQSGPVLCLDIGSVTQDVVLARSGVDTENWPRFVLPSPSQTIAQRIRELTLLRRDVWLYGAEMGGNFAPAVESCLKSGRNIYATRAAADSLDRNPAMVRQMGVVITEVCPDGCVPVDLRDYSPQFWDNFLRSAGMPQPHLGRSGSRYSFPRQQQGFAQGVFRETPADDAIAHQLDDAPASG